MKLILFLHLKKKKKNYNSILHTLDYFHGDYIYTV